MAPTDTDHFPEQPAQHPEHVEAAEPGRARKAARYAVPAAVIGVAAATIGLVPALAAAGDPDLPAITAEQLIEKIAASDTQRVSGTVKVTTDLGLPSLAGLDLGKLTGEPDAGKGGSAKGGSADPVAKLMELASGTHTFRIAADGPEKQRLTYQDGAEEYSVIHNGTDAWAYDSAAGEAVHSRVPAGEKGEEQRFTTPKGFAAEALKAVDDTTSVTVDGTARIAGRDAYQLVIRPKQAGSTIGSVTIAVDAEQGVPLKFTLTPSSGGKAAVDAGFTKVDFGAPDASEFAFTPPKGTEVTEEDAAKDAPKASEPPHGLKVPKSPQSSGASDSPFGDDLNVVGAGWTSVARFGGGPAGTGAPKDAPAELGGLLDSLGDKVTGKFGSGTIFKTRLVNALLTDDGKIYVGAVTQDRLVAVANGATR
ncbi:DUF2092 domain-containing protein [Streptomyces sp. LP05-1]|uniref:DUF2092 domain-containing protein n=1 Tax=Streptomyces pyxinae TaxID=2970734 RepID=A0ABT2CNS1_9ACTN|nr:DUF2092 domain-containing protein [Streptomyces sp. LP05-1]MCS0639074.1 DUF2092 domain-containing protein [Streptomyces sp. LP05-1]